MDEKQLLTACRNGDRKAQKMLFEMFAPKMYGVCLRYAKDEDTAQDYLQEGFIRVFSHLGNFRHEGSLEGWVRRIIVNTALEKLRKTDIFKNSLEVETALNKASDGAQVIDQINTADLLQLIQSLPSGFRTVFNLYAIEGYTHQEIGDLLRISEGTSKSQYSRARQWLQQRIIQKEKSDGKAR
ncbi:MAG TPA: sigma-70 family RNA polymerase sigma factor [Bacteroidales bacterium]|nr:sigma-70 family RNA polymerase sigma factor [Bacteroidales bacterium]